MDVHEAIRIRRSVRSYLSRPIPDDVLARCRCALRYAPSACNYQPWRFIFVFDNEQRHQVAEAACDQMWMAEAPVIVIGCGLPDEAYQSMGGYGNSSDIDVAIALDHLTLAAVTEGLGTCWVGAFDEMKVRRLLGIPEQVSVVAMTPLGYPVRAELLVPLAENDRKAETVVFFTDRYGRE